MKILRIFSLSLLIIFNSCETSSSDNKDKNGVFDSNNISKTNRDTITSGYDYEENKSFEKGIHKQVIDTVYFGNYYSDEVINSQGISLALLNEQELFNNDGGWCFMGGKKYKFKVGVTGISQKVKLKNVAFSVGKIMDIDSTERTFTYIPPQELVKVDVDYSIEARILSIERIVDSTAKKGYRETIEFIDGLFDTMKIQACKGGR